MTPRTAYSKKKEYGNGYS